jgi:hypothetical protein
MNRLLLAILGAAFFVSTIATAKTVIKDKDVCRDGYLTVVESYTSATDTYKITCMDPGLAGCEFTVYDPGCRVMPYAENQIDLGHMVGTYTMYEAGVEYHVEWDATVFPIHIVETQTGGMY